MQKACRKQQSAAMCRGVCPERCFWTCRGLVCLTICKGAFFVWGGGAVEYAATCRDVPRLFCGAAHAQKNPGARNLRAESKTKFLAKRNLSQSKVNYFAERSKRITRKLPAEMHMKQLLPGRPHGTSRGENRVSLPCCA